MTTERKSPHKQHYKLQISFDVRADTLEKAIKRVANLFRAPHRDNLQEGMVYMGTHSAIVRKVGKRNRYHPTVRVEKGLPVEPRDPQEQIDREEADRAQRKTKRKATGPKAGPKAKLSGLAALLKGRISDEVQQARPGRGDARDGGQ
jgi:hypothetical protein